MNNNLTVKTLSYNLVYSDKDGSLRRETSRGVTLPSELTIRHQDYIDSSTKKAGKRSVVRIDRTVAGTDGTPIIVSAYLVVAVPIDPIVSSSSDVLEIVAELAEMIKTDGTTHLDLADDIFVNGEQ
jgi:hypothetical protein